MQLASSLYKGGELIAATGANYSISRELGLICPFCKESVFWVREYTRNGTPIAAAWRHYRMSTQSAYCENRALSKEGKEELKALQKTAQNQRLRLFNRRFWEIFRHKKFMPTNLKKCCLQFMDEQTLDRMVEHCRQQWYTDQILQALPDKINKRLGNRELVEASLRNHPAWRGQPTDEVDRIVSDFVQIRFGMLRLKILSEVIIWLKLDTARESFTKLIYLSLIDCFEALPLPIHSQSVAEMALLSLTLTDWEEAIASLEEKTKAIGFG